MIKRRFKVRVRHYASLSYTVEYSYHWIFPTYKGLDVWNDSFKKITPFLTDVRNAEKIAKEFKSIEDVTKWNSCEYDKRKEQYPYEVKQVL